MNFFQKNIFWVGLILTLVVLWPYSKLSLLSHQQDKQLLYLQQMHKCFLDHQFPCRWTPDLSGSYGSATFDYVAPLPYYIGEIILLMIDNIILSYNLLFIIAVLGSYVFMFLLGRKLWGEVGGALSGLFYVYAPYHAVSLYVRGDLGELWAMMILPALLWSIIKLWQEVKVKDVLLVGLMIAALILSSDLFSMLFLPIAIVFTIVLYLQKKEKRLLRFTLVAILFGLLLPSFYLLPSIFERSLVHPPTDWPYLAYSEHFKGLYRLIIDRGWGFGPSLREIPGGAKDTMSYQIGWIHLLAGLGGFLGMIAYSKKNRLVSARRRLVFVSFSTAIVALAIFMIHPLSKPVWQTFKPLTYFPYPWQFLTVVTFFTSLISGSLIAITKESDRLKVAFVSGLLVIVFNLGYFYPEKFLNLKTSDLYQGDYYFQKVAQTNFDFLPKDATIPASNITISPFEYISGASPVTNFQKTTNYISFDIKGQELTTIKLSQHYFPNWQVFVDDQSVAINPHNTYGLMVFGIDPGIHHVQARFYQTQVRKLADVLSLIGGGIFIFLVLSQMKVTRRWLLYYFSSLYR